TRFSDRTPSGSAAPVAKWIPACAGKAYMQQRDDESQLDYTLLRRTNDRSGQAGGWQIGNHDVAGPAAVRDTGNHCRSIGLPPNRLGSVRIFLTRSTRQVRALPSPCAERD